MQKRSLRFAIFKWIAVCMQLISCSNRLGIRSNGSSYLLKKKNGQPFERLQLSMQKNIVICLSGSGYLFKKNCQLFEWLELSVQKTIVFCWNSSGYPLKKTIRTARAICSKKIGNRSKARSSYLFEEEFCWVSIPEQLPHQLLVSNDLLFSMYS